MVVFSSQAPSWLVCLPCYVAYIISNSCLCVIMQNCFHGVLDCPDNNHHLPTSNEFFWWQQQPSMQPWALCIQITEVDTYYTIVLKSSVPKLKVYIYINFHVCIKNNSSSSRKTKQTSKHQRGKGNVHIKNTQ